MTRNKIKLGQTTNQLLSENIPSKGNGPLQESPTMRTPNQEGTTTSDTTDMFKLLIHPCQPTNPQINPPIHTRRHLQYKNIPHREHQVMYFTHAT